MIVFDNFVPDKYMSNRISGPMNAASSSLLITSMYGFLYCIMELSCKQQTHFS